MKLKNSDISKIIRQIIKEDDTNIVSITPDEYMELLKRVNFQAQAIPKLPRFKNKTLVVLGNVNLSGIDKITDLGPIRINGSLDVSNTNIRTLDQTDVSGIERIWGTPLEQIRQSIILNRKLSEQSQLRIEGEWDLDNPGISEEGEQAQALFQYIDYSGYIETISEDDEEEIERLKLEIKNLEEEQENLSTDDEDYSEKFDEITDKQVELEEELDKILDKKIDVYDLYFDGTHYKLNRFLSLSTNMEFAVGTYDDANSSLEDYYGELIDTPEHYFSKDHLVRYIDEKEVIEYFEDSIREWITDDPEGYGVQLELSNSQEEEIWLLEMEKWVYKNEGVRAPIMYPTKEKDGTFDFMDAENNSLQYKNDGRGWVLYKEGQIVSPHQIYDDEDTEEHEDAREDRISNIDYEIEDIKENPDGEPSDDAIEEAVEDYIYNNIERDVSGFLRDMGTDFEDFIDKDQLLKDLVDDEDYGSLNGYDGRWDSYTINGTSYVVMRID